VELFAPPLDGWGQRRADAAPLVAEQGEQADRGTAQMGGMYLKAATLIGAKISDNPVINTTLGQITIPGLISRFISAIQQFPAAMIKKPAAINRRASTPLPMSAPTTNNPMTEKTPEGDCTNSER
jgi:hypothetical protein